jgi:hypothetical protein
MPKIKYPLLVSAAIALAACKFSPNVPDGRIHCNGLTECPSGYFCVGNSASSPGVCCKDKSCSSGPFLSQDGGGDGPMTRLDGRGSDAATSSEGVGGSSGAGGSIGQGGASVTGGATNGGGTTSVGGSIIQGGATSIGGSTNAGGTTNVGGTSIGGSIGKGGAPAIGGSTNAGGTTNVGGVIGPGGTTSTGGAAKPGGAIGTGGTTITGGTTSVGGASSVGGSVRLGGTTSMGGAVSTGGTIVAGGSIVTGGTTTLGGTTSAGGTSATGGATGTGGSTCSVTPVSPNASPQAKNLLCYLYSQSGNHVLSGQQESNFLANPTDISWYITNGMKYPAILGSDFLYRDGAACTAVTPSTMRGIAYWNAGGLTMFHYHMGMPGVGLTCANDCFSGTNCSEPSSPPTPAFFTAVVTNGTPENASLNAKLDYMAVQIGAMQTANVPVILALFHETQANGWFWWSMAPTATAFVQLWTYTFNYLTQIKNLTNIIWLMPFSGLPSAAYFPGTSYVDISGADTFGTSQPFTSLYSACRADAAPTTAMPTALYETGTVPTPSAMFPSAAPWILFNVWSGFETSANTVTNLQSVYSDPHTITRDLIPSLK